MWFTLEQRYKSATLKKIYAHKHKFNHQAASNHALFFNLPFILSRFCWQGEKYGDRNTVKSWNFPKPNLQLVLRHQQSIKTESIAKLSNFNSLWIVNDSRGWIKHVQILVGQTTPDIEDGTSDSLTFQSVVENQCHRVPLSEVDLSYN